MNINNNENNFEKKFLVYEKDGKTVVVGDKFIYSNSIYQIWKSGAMLLNEQFYSSNKPITLSKKDLIKKKNGYIIQRFLELEYAPEEYLWKEGYKLI